MIGSLRAIARRRVRLSALGTGGIAAIIALLLLGTLSPFAKTSPDTPPSDQNKIVAIIPEDAPPTYYRDQVTGAASGFAVELTNAIARRAGLSVTYRFAKNWEEIRSVMQRGEADLVPGLSISAKRGLVYSFSEPFDVFTISYFARASFLSSTLKDGAAVGAIRGSVAAEFLYPEAGVRVVPYINFETGLFDLLAGKIDAFACPAPIFLRLARETGVDDQIKIVGKPIAEVRRAFGLNNDRPELLKRINKAMEGFVGSPQYQRLYTKWYGKPPGPYIALSKRNVWILAAFASVVVAMACWRHVSLMVMNEQLHDEIEERKILENDLMGIQNKYRHNEERLRLALGASQQGWFDLDVPTGKAVVSPEYAAMLGYEAEEFHPNLQGWLDSMHPEDRPLVLKEFNECLESGEARSMEYRRQTKAGNWLWIRSTGKVVEFDAQHRPLRMTGTHADISERKRAEEQIIRSLAEKEVLLKEVHHRVKNNMQVIYSLLNLQAKGIKDQEVRTMFEETRNRVNSMSLIHEQLYRSTELASIDFKEYLKALVSGIAKTYSRQEVIVSVDMDPIAMDVNTGIPCGLIVNELVSNCFKHAFPEGRKGTIQLGLSRDTHGVHTITIADDGAGLPAELDFRNSPSLGLQLVQVLTGQIHGAIELSKTGETRFTITFPVAT
jgi:PAS domain S-box-containing protein